MKKYIYTTTLGIAVLTILLACTKKDPAEASEKSSEQPEMVVFNKAQYKSAGIELGKVEKKNLSTTIQVNGLLDVPPQNLVTVSAIMGGFIKSTELLQGMKVKKGQIIATIQNPEFIQVQREYLENKSKLSYLDLEYKRQEELSKENVASTKIFQQVTSEYHSLQATNGALEDPNLTDKSFTGPGANYIYWDEIHPTTKVNVLTAARAFQNVSVQLNIQHNAAGTNLLVSNLYPGLPYTVQSSTNLLAWTDYQTITPVSTNATVAWTNEPGTKVFYRVQY